MGFNSGFKGLNTLYIKCEVIMLQFFYVKARDNLFTEFRFYYRTINKAPIRGGKL